MENIGFNDIIKSSMMNLNTGTTLSIIDVFIGLIVTLICAIIISWTYKNTYQGVLYQKSFSVAIILVSLVTTGIIMVISGNLVLSLGMVGALSIIRFRAAIKDPLDIVYMFWAISIGIANGVAYLKVSITSTIILSIIMILLKKIPFTSSPYLLVVKYINDFDVENNIKSHSKFYKTKSKSIKNGNAEVVYEVRGVNGDILLRELDEESDVIDVTLISYNSNS